MATDRNPAKLALVTGGTSGIGFELARCFAKAGYSLILVARSEEGLQHAAARLREEFGCTVHILQKDLMVPGAARAVYETIAGWGLTVQILVNNAGQGLWGNFSETDLDREIDLVHLNIISLISLTKYYLKEMLARKEGRILQVASQLSKAPSPYMSVYAATKAFVYSFTEALVQEAKDSGVTLTALMPGATDTDFFHKAEAIHSKEYRESSIYDPADVAQAGFEALMSGKDKVMPGLKNKMQGLMGTIIPDTLAASSMKEHLKESTKQGGRSEIGHPVSKSERERIQRETGRPDGDMEGHERHPHED